VALGTGLDKCGKISPPPGFDPRTVQPVVSRYTDYATQPTSRCFMPYIIVNFRSCVEESFVVMVGFGREVLGFDDKLTIYASLLLL
jgi:hypothetical protein